MTFKHFIEAVNAMPPTSRLGRGSCDTHNHVFGPFERFPLDFPPDYPIPLAPIQKYLQMLDTVGLDRGVLIQPSQQDCSMDILLDALRIGGDRLRGVGAARAEITEQRMQEVVAAGVVGLRFVEAHAPHGKPRAGSVGFRAIPELATRMKALDLSINIWGKLPDIISGLDAILAPELPVVLEHMGMLDIGAGIESRDFQTLLGLLKEGRIWVKLSVCRCSSAAPDYADLRPFADLLVEANPDRLLWGSDWPFIRMQGVEPDVGNLADLFHVWINDSSVQRKILIDNPGRLYKFSSLGDVS